MVVNRGRQWQKVVDKWQAIEGGGKVAGGGSERWQTMEMVSVSDSMWQLAVVSGSQW